MRPSQALLLALLLAAPRAALAQDWDVGPRRPSPVRPRPVRPGPARPRPAVPRPVVTTPATGPAAPAESDRRARMIDHLLENLLRDPDGNAAMLPTLLRLVRERDGGVDRLVASLEPRLQGDQAASAAMLLGQIHQQNGRFDDARAMYERARTRSPDDPAPRRRLAELERQLGHADEAAQQYAAALPHLRDDGARAEVLRALMDLSLSRRDVAAARGYHQQLRRMFPASASVRRELADAMLTRQLDAEAIPELQSLTRDLAGDNRVLPPVLRDLGRAQMRTGDLDGALATLRRALTLSGADGGVTRQLYDDLTEVYTQRHELDAWVRTLQQGGAATPERAMLLGRLLAQEGHVDEAIAAYRRAVSLRPADVDAHVALIQLLSQAGRLEELIAARRRLVVAAPHNPAYVVELADELVRGGHRAEAMQLLAGASARAGSDAEVHERLAQAYARMGEQALALRETELVARYDPTDPGALESLGERWLEQGQRERAMTTWARIRDTARDRTRGTLGLADVYARHDMANEALALYREVAAAHPDAIDAFKGMAVLLEQSRAFAPAVEAWRRVIALSGDDRELRREARSRIVNLWDLQGALGAQVATLEQAFHATPPDLEAGRDLAEAYVRMHRATDAEAVLQRLAEAEPGDIATLVALERARTQRGDLEGASETLRRLAEADPRRARDWYQRLAQHALALHHDAEALDYAARVVQLNPDDATGHLRLGELYRARNDVPQAIASFRRALALNDRLFPTYFQLADLYLGRGDARDAVDLYRRVVQLAPDDELVARAGHHAIQIAIATDQTAELERDLSGASASAPGRVVLRRLLVDLYLGLCRPWINEIRFGSADARARARTALSRYSARALKPLLDTLADGDPARQRASMEILGFLGNPNATAALLTVAENTEADVTLRRAALRAAAALADARALPRLTAMLANTDSYAVVATWGIARIRTPAAVAALTRVLRTSGNSDMRAMAALGLAGQRSPLVRQGLLAVLDQPGDGAAQAAAILALGASGDVTVLPRVRAALADGFWQRAAALVALSTLGPRELAVQEITAALFSPLAAPAGGGDLLLARVAARALERATSATPTAWTAEFDDPSRAESAVAMLRALVDPPSDPARAREALTRHRAVIITAARAALAFPEGHAQVLSSLSSPGRFAPLVDRDDPEAESVRRVVIQELAPQLAPLAAAVDPARRRLVLRVLAVADAPEALAALVRATDDPDVSVAEAALRALASREADLGSNVERVAARLADESPWSLRLAAVEALAHTRGAASVLARALSHDRVAWVRGAAVAGLARVRDDVTAREALDHAAQHDDDPTVRTLAREALAR